jgi:acetyl-CoA C-acetyltransferase/acetyl-CoA acyltransferase
VVGLVYITGVGLVNVDRHYDKSVRKLAFEASVAALDSSMAESIDFIVVASSLSYLQEPQLDLASYIASSMGLRGVRSIAVESGEASGLAAVMTAKSLVDSGSASRVLVVGVDKLSDHPSWRVYRNLSMLYDSESDAFYSIGLGGVAGLLMRLYMDVYKVDRQTLAYWPALMHSNAKANPYAMLRFAITPEKVLEAPPVAEPLTLLDTFPLGDGAAAIVVEGRAGGGAIAEIVAIESSTGFQSIALSDDPLKIESLETAYRRLVERVDVKDVDVVELHDSFTITGILELETLRLAERGKAAEAVAQGNFSIGGEGPVVNPSGGLKARGHPIGATGLYQVAEIALQLSGEFPGLKVEGARGGLAVAVNAMGSSSYVAYLKAVR